MEHSNLARTSRVPHAPLIADVVSWGYGIAVIVAGLVFNLSMSLPLGIAVMVIFLLLRGVARAIRQEQRRSTPVHS